MTMLSRAAFDTSRQFIEANARPLEIARFHSHFDGASHEPVIAALEEFRNADGGFGCALEPDVRASESSALSTSVAFQVLRSTGALLDDALVSPSTQYLLKTLNRKMGHWRIIPQSAQESSHAPWWDQTDAKAFDRFSLNPTAEILGYLYDYQQLVPSDIISSVSDRVTGHLSGLDEIEMHDLLCCLRLLRTEALPENARERIHQKLTHLVAATIACDPADWEGYSLRPLQVVHDSKSPFMAGIEEAVGANLDYEISSQNEDGSWSPSWSWEGANPGDGARARLEWSGILTLENLLTLKRFNRIEGLA